MPSPASQHPRPTPADRGRRPAARRTAAAAVLCSFVVTAGCAGTAGDATPVERVAQSAPLSSVTPSRPSAAAGPSGPPAGPSQPAGSSPTPSRGSGSDLAIAAEPAPVTVAFGGDVHFEPPIRSRLAADPGTALSPVASVLSAADLAVVNLETAITERGTPAGKSFTFRAPPSALTALRGAGVDVASMANNHGMDFGRVGLADSLAAARAARFPVIGIGADEDAAYAPYRATVNGSRLAVIAASSVLDDSLIEAWTARDGVPGLASAKRLDRLVAQVRAARRDSDAVIVYLHWGVEKESCPTGSQRDLADRLAEAGADVVVGSHAHVLLGGGWHRRGAYVDYGLGNFAFYARTAKATETGVLTLTLRGRDVTDARWTPARIRAGVPVPQSGAQGRALAAGKERLRGCTDLLAAPPR